MPAEATDRQAAFLVRIAGWMLVACGAVALVAATALMVEKVRMLEDPTRVPACTIDAVLACGSVMNSDQAEAFGIPNPLLGIAGFAALTAIGVTVLAGASLPRWLWLTVQAGVTFAACFVHSAVLSERVPDRGAVPVLHGGLDPRASSRSSTSPPTTSRVGSCRPGVR